MGATNRSDFRWVFSSTSGSNWGRCVDIFAPGQDVLSLGVANDTATFTRTGTSMAAPHVAGVAALYLQSFQGATPQQVRDELVAMGTVGVLQGDLGLESPNLLLWSRMFDGHIFGPDSLQENVVGEFYGFSFGGAYPHTHRWYVDGVLVDTETTNSDDGFSYYANTWMSSFTVRLEVTDARGKVLSFSKSVTVHPPICKKPPCPISPQP